MIALGRGGDLSLNLAQCFKQHAIVANDGHGTDESGATPSLGMR
jgi:hypothetical protein